MKTVTMCEYCNTIMEENECSQHEEKCKYNPKNKNCTSCKYNKFKSIPFIGMICGKGKNVGDAFGQLIYITTCENYESK